MINEEKAKRYCCEDITKIYGYAEAVADKENMWHCHHCLGLAYTKEQLIEKGLYYNQPAEMLIFCTKSEHFILHNVTRIVSDETKRRLSVSHKGNVVSETARQKISIKLSKKVEQLTKDGDVIAEYKSTIEAHRCTNVNLGHISQCCNGKRKTAGGYCWRFAE